MIACIEDPELIREILEFVRCRKAPPDKVARGPPLRLSAALELD